MRILIRAKVKKGGQEKKKQQKEGEEGGRQSWTLGTLRSEGATCAGDFVEGSKELNCTGGGRHLLGK